MKGHNKKNVSIVGKQEKLLNQFVIFKPLSYCFEETKGFEVKASFASRP